MSTGCWSIARHSPGSCLRNWRRCSRAAPSRIRLQLAPGATYLVTGGRGGFGLATAEWLASNGARHLALIGRSQTTAPDAATALDRLRKDGVAIREFSAD